jgi:hypothetical protein
MEARMVEERLQVHVRDVALLHPPAGGLLVLVALLSL